MIRIEREHYFAVPVEAGFAFITDMANWPRYWPGFVSGSSPVRGGAPRATRSASSFGFLGGESSLRRPTRGRRFKSKRGFTWAARLRPSGEFAVCGNTMAPGFVLSDFEAASAEELVAGWPQRAELIRALTRE